MQAHLVPLEADGNRMLPKHGLEPSGRLTSLSESVASRITRRL